MSAIAIYRQDALAALIERDRLVAARDAALSRAAGAAVTYQRRITRIAAGTALIVAGLMLWLGALLALCDSRLQTETVMHLSVLAIPGAWLLALVAGAIAWRSARVAAARSLVRVDASDDPWRDLAQLQALAAYAPVWTRAAQLERASIARPLIGLSLIMPITIHALVALPFAGWDFAIWIGWSAVIAGPAHVTLAVCAWSYARALSRNQAEHWGGWAALWMTTGVSAMPFVLLLGIPTILVFLTGALFVPFAWARMRKRVLAERNTLDAVG